MVTGVDIADAIESARKNSIVKPYAEVASFLLATIGPRVATVGLGLADARPIKQWAADDAEPRELAADKLRTLYTVTASIMALYEKATVAVGFLRSANPQLDDESPLRIIAAGEDNFQAVTLGALRAFLEG